MSLGLIARLRRYRRPAVMVAAGLIAMQAFLAGLGLAPAALVLTPGLDDFAVICHGNGGTLSDAGTRDGGTAPEPAQNGHPCCVSCTAAAPPAILPAPVIVLRADRGRILQSPRLRAASIPIARRAVRAGSSQAPPSLA
jgi:hypothetical protein